MWRGLAILIGAAAFGSLPSAHWPAAPSAQAEHSFASRLLSDRAGDWVTVEVPGVRIHVQRGNAGIEGRALASLVTVTRSNVLAQLGAVEPQHAVATADLFFVNSRDQTQRLTGRPLVGFVQPDEPTGVFVSTPGYRIGTLLHHELNHLYAFQTWGQTSAGPWLVEGLAAWAAGTCQGHTNDALAAGALAHGRLVSVNQLADRFREVDEVVAMPQAGSLVGFLIARHGTSSVRERWQKGRHPSEHPLGRDGFALEKAWLDRLRAVQPAYPDVTRLMREGC